MSREQPFQLAPDGNPFPSEAACNKAIKDKGDAAGRWAPRKHQGGWAMVDVDALLAQVADNVDAGATNQPKQRYFFIKISERIGTNEPRKVPIVIPPFLDIAVKRGVKTVLPEMAIEVLDHAVREDWQPSPDPRQPMVSGGTLRTYNYEKLGEATEADFRNELAGGNALTNTFIESVRSQAGRRLV